MLKKYTETNLAKLTLGGLLGLVAILPLTGCVASSSEIELLAPVAPECTYSDGSFSIKGGSGGSTTLWNDFSVAPSQNQVILIYEDETTHTKTPLENPPGIVEMGLSMHSNLNVTTAHTKIGAGAELRIDQNTFEANKVTYTVVDGGGVGDNLKIAEKPISGTVSPKGSATIVVPFLDENYPDDKDFITAIGTNQTIVTVKVQVSGKLRGGQSAVSSAMTLPVKFNMSKSTTRVCGGKDSK